MYLMGTGAKQSYEKAKHWLQLSYENGIEASEAVWNKYELWNYWLFSTLKPVIVVKIIKFYIQY